MGPSPALSPLGPTLSQPHSRPPCQGQGSPRGRGGAVVLTRSVSIGLEGSRLALYEEQLVSQVPFTCRYAQLSPRKNWCSVNLVIFEQIDRPTAPDPGPLGSLELGCSDLVAWQVEMAWPSP